VIANITVSGAVNTAVAGNYPLTYTVSDSKGLTDTASCVVTVVAATTTPDPEPEPEPVNTAPVIVGVSNKTINVGDSFNSLAGVSASDAEDGAIANITVNGTVNTAVAGTYPVSYSVTDSKGLTTTVSCVVTVKAVDAPIANGTYDPAKIYLAGDTVTYNGETYRAKWWIQGGGTPDNNGAWEQVSDNEGGIGAYSPTKEYLQNDQVTYNGLVYQAKWWTKGDVPGNSDVWQLV
jgi:chitinase